MNKYIGNGSYCYANSASMLLASIGEEISPSLIEVITGVGLSAFWMDDKNLLFFNFALPDEEISRAFHVLGFSCKERVISKENSPPIDQIKEDLTDSPIMVGPLDMGYLTYNPNYNFLHGSDHFVLIYGYKEDDFRLHDPEKFPCVLLSPNQLKKAWNSNKIFYGKENYRYWTSPKKVKDPAEKEVYKKAVEGFKSIYESCAAKSQENGWITGEEAIIKAANRFEENDFSSGETDHLKYFALPLGAKRALDFARFFEGRNNILAGLKRTQAELFGSCHTFLMRKKWSLFSQNLRRLAQVESEFKSNLLS